MNAPPVNLRFNAMTRYGIEPLWSHQRNSARACACDNGFGQRMLGRLIGRRCKAQQFIIAQSTGRDHVGQRRLALGQHAGLVENHRVDGGGGFERGGILEQHTFARAFADTDGNCSRRSQGQRVGAGDHDSGYGRGESEEKG